MAKRRQIQRATDTLRLFNEKVAKLLSFTFVKEIQRSAGGAIVEYRHGKGWDGIFVGPGEEAVDAVILTLRLFMQNNDRLALQRVRSLYAESGVSAQLVSEFMALSSTFNSQLDTPTNIAIEEGKRLTYRDVLQIFIYGSHGHTSSRWHRIHRDLKTTPFFPVVQTDFVMALAFFIQTLYRMSLLNRRAISELERPRAA